MEHTVATSLETIVIDKNGEVRSGWRIFMFLLLVALVWTLLAVPFEMLDLISDSLMRLLGLIAALIASIILLKTFHAKPLAAVGLSLHRAAPREFGYGVVLSFLIQATMFLVAFAAGWLTIQSQDLSALEDVQVFFSAGIFFLLVAALEEVLFRGYIFQSLMKALSVLPAMLLMAIAFSLSHALNPHADALGFLNVALAAVWLSVGYLKTRSLWLPIGLHFGWNFSQTTLFGLPTSGVRFAERSLLDTAGIGPGWITGGDFGPEGGLLATIALLCCTWYILKSNRIKRPEGIVTLDSVEAESSRVFPYSTQATDKETA